MIDETPKRIIKDGEIYQEFEILDKDTGNKKQALKKLSPKNYSMVASDQTFISVEIYNQLKEDMFFVSMLSEDKGLPHQKIAIKGEDFGFLPHQNYIGSTKSGAPLKMIKNYGKCKFIGNKQPTAFGIEEN